MLWSSWSILKNCGYLCRTLDIRDGSRYVWMADGVHGLKRALSGSVCNVCTVKLDNWTALAALGSKARRHQLCLAQTQTTAKATKNIWCLQRRRDTSGTWLRSPPWHFKVIYLASDILCASSNYIHSFELKHHTGATPRPPHPPRP